MKSEFDLLRVENARLMAKITGLEFEKAEPFFFVLLRKRYVF